MVELYQVDNPRTMKSTFSIATFIWIALFATPATGAKYSVFWRADGLSLSRGLGATESVPVSLSHTAAYANVFGQIGRQEVELTADRGQLKGKLSISGNHYVNRKRGEFLASFEGDVEICHVSQVAAGGCTAGPPPVPVPTPFPSIAQMEASCSASAGPNLRAKCAATLTVTNKGKSRSRSAETTNSSGDETGTLKGITAINVSTDLEYSNPSSVITVRIRAKLDGWAFSGSPRGSATADGSSTFQFPIGAPVFVLPEGFTAYSSDLNIVDNYWTPPQAVPVPAALPLLGSALAGFGFLVRCGVA